MNRIEEMLRELCPDGVEYRPLGEVASIRTGAKPSVLEDCGRFSYVNGGVKESGRTQESNARGGVVTIPSRGSVGIASYQFSDFWLGPLCYEVRADVGLMEARFLFHFLKSVERSLIALQQTGSIPALNKKELIGFKVPVPPLEIQREIVRILDSFTELEVELEVELEARRKQYVFYRDQLLNFESARGGGRTSVLGLPPFEVRWATLGEVGCFYGGLTGKSKADFGASGSRFVSYKNVFENSATRLDCESFVKIEPGEKQNALHYGDVLFTGSSENREEAGMSSVLLEEPGEETFLNSFCICYRWSVLSEVEPAFYRHLFRARSVRVAISKTAMGVTRFNLSKAELKKISIPIPPLDVQRRIADVLDSFDALVNDLSSGLPAEIAARRKQYEYYRDKLLTFPEKK